MSWDEVDGGEDILGMQFEERNCEMKSEQRNRDKDIMSSGRTFAEMQKMGGS